MQRSIRKRLKLDLCSRRGSDRSRATARVCGGLSALPRRALQTGQLLANFQKVKNAIRSPYSFQNPYFRILISSRFVNSSSYTFVRCPIVLCSCRIKAISFGWPASSKGFLQLSQPVAEVRDAVTSIET